MCVAPSTSLGPAPTGAVTHSTASRLSALTATLWAGTPGSSGALKVARTVNGVFESVTTQGSSVPQLAASPPQPAKTLSPVAVAVRVTSEPVSSSSTVQTSPVPSPQSMPMGLETAPVPVPSMTTFTVTVSGGRATTSVNLAVTLLSASMVTSQVASSPEQAPVHSSSSQPVAGTATRVTSESAAWELVPAASSPVAVSNLTSPLPSMLTTRSNVSAGGVGPEQAAMNTASAVRMPKVRSLCTSSPSGTRTLCAPRVPRAFCAWASTVWPRPCAPPQWWPQAESMDAGGTRAVTRVRPRA